MQSIPLQSQSLIEQFVDLYQNYRLQQKEVEL